jgi:hydroxymethylpyrimidine/phosphomethylpyrimidine kinase
VEKVGKERERRVEDAFHRPGCGGGAQPHADGTDLLDDGGEPLPIPGPVHADGAAHGSGCTHSSTLAGLLALGFPLRDAAVAARHRAADAVAAGLRDVGGGPGPVDALAIASRRPLPPLP